MFIPQLKTNLVRLNLLFWIFVTIAGCAKEPLKAPEQIDTKTVVTPPVTPLVKPAIIPTIVVMGSSTAEGVGADPIDSSWVYRVTAAVNKNQKKATFIDIASAGCSLYQVMPSGCGVKGMPAPDTTININKAFSYHPSLVLLNFPSNDIAYNYTDDQILSTYATLTHLLDSAKVAYIIFGTQPRDFSDINQRMRLKTLNDKIIAIYSTHVNNFLSQLSDATYNIKPMYSAGDGIHLNDAGHLVIANATLKQPIFIKITGQ